MRDKTKRGTIMSDMAGKKETAENITNKDYITVEAILQDVLEELNRANTKYPLFFSEHEGYAIILEEIDELWDEVKKKNPDRLKMRAEAVQVAAMAIKFLISMEIREKVIK